MNTRAHIFISGLVQGIGFRSWVRWLARKMQLKGWVRNTDDKVEIVVEGLSAVMKDFEEALWKGPIGSRVESVVLTVENYKGEFSDFVVKK
ncbi:MAG TPA: acylphosphatase [Candidatus Nanoarchaeia archaeon]|nr:acylphosphatase [Candidatus Nanoarchaeia archaeon]